MTTAFSQTYQRTFTLTAIICAVLFAVSFVPLLAHAESEAPSSPHRGHMKERDTKNNDAMERLKNKIAELELKRAELEMRFKSFTGSSTAQGRSGEWKDRFCRGEGYPGMGTTTRAGGMSPAVRDRVCGHWDKASTTPAVKPPKASTTPMVKVHQPNGGVRYKHRVDGAVLVSWRNTTSDKTVDIDLKKGSTTTSIAKDVTGKKHGAPKNGGNASSSPAVLGASTYSGMLGNLSNGHSHQDIGNRGKSLPVLTYRWMNAPVGEGYKIVITTKVGDTTYTDESDKEFSVKKMPRGMHEDDEEDGAVLGAASSVEDDVRNALASLEADLIEMLVQVSS